MMQPLSLQNRTAFTPGLAGTVSNPGLSAATSAAPPQLDQAGTGSQNSMASMGPILLQMLQSLLMIMQQMMGQGQLGSGGNADQAGPSGGNIGPVDPYGSASNGTPGMIAPPVTGGGSTTPPLDSGGATESPPCETETSPATDGGTTAPPTGGGTETPPATDGGMTAPPLPATLPGGAQGNGQAADESVDQIRNTDYSSLTEAQRVQFNGVSRDSAAVIHLGGRANISGAVTENGVSPTAQIYNNVLQNPDNFKPSEQALVKQWSQDEISRRGMITGENLDHAFIDEMGIRDGVSPQQLQQYHTAVDQRVNQMLANPNQAGVKADSENTLNLVDDTTILQQQSGLNKTEQAAFRLAGHSVLFSGDGKVNGDILAITMGNPNALDNKGSNSGTIDAEIKALTDADVADNGKIDGSSLRTADGAVLGKLYGGGAGIANNQQVVNQGVQAGMSSGRSMQDIQKSIMNGGQQALNDFKTLAKNHSPAMIAAGATMAGAAAVCPFLGGMAAGAAGIGAAQKMMNKDNA